MKFNGINKARMLLLIPFFVFCSNPKTSEISDNSIQNQIPKVYSKTEFAKQYKWVSNYDTASTLLSRINLPEGFERIKDSASKFTEWLLNLPLKPKGTPVKLYNGEEKGSQDVHFAVIDIDCGNKDLQQCADAVMRLRAEFLYGSGQKENIHFNYTSGDKIPFKKWSEGFRPQLKGNNVNWAKSKVPSADYKTFKEYLWNVFNYAGSMSISKEMKAVKNFKEIKAGDVLIVGGFPGHAMTVMDVALNKKTGKKIFILSQSYMPAQDIHIVKNPNNADLSPWYEIPSDGIIRTPEWTFETKNLMRWQD